jgi:hypothetical protein
VRLHSLSNWLPWQGQPTCVQRLDMIVKLGTVSSRLAAGERRQQSEARGRQGDGEGNEAAEGERRPLEQPAARMTLVRFPATPIATPSGATPGPD